MPEQREEPGRHGDPMRDRVKAEDNRAQRDSDAAPDVIGSGDGERREQSDRADGRGSSANGIPEFDEDKGKQRRKQYEEGADLVSGLD